MVMKALFGGTLGLIAFTLFVIGPRGWTVDAATPRKVERDQPTAVRSRSSGSSGTSRGPRSDGGGWIGK